MPSPICRDLVAVAPLGGSKGLLPVSVSAPSGGRKRSRALRGTADRCTVGSVPRPHGVSTEAQTPRNGFYRVACGGGGMLSSSSAPSQLHDILRASASPLTSGGVSARRPSAKCEAPSPCPGRQHPTTPGGTVAGFPTRWPDDLEPGSSPLYASVCSTVK